MLTEYYADVHKILALPKGHVVTYDYSERNVSAAAIDVLRKKAKARQIKVRAVLAYVQAETYKKGAGTNAAELLGPPTLQTLTRLGEVIEVREIRNNNKTRYYVDIELHDYPYDKDQVTAKRIIDRLRDRGEIPMKTYIAIYPEDSADALFTRLATTLEEEAFTQIVDALSTPKSQFARDTFWRITKITFQTKSLIPLRSTATAVLSPKVESNEDRRYSFLESVDQSSLQFHLQYHRGQEHGTNYRIRRISVESSPKSSSNLAQSSFSTRSFGQEIVGVTIPATSSLSKQEGFIQFITNLHECDDQKDYCYGPQIAIAVQYRKALGRSLMAIAVICLASGLFAWAGFTTSVAADVPKLGSIVSIGWRVAAAVIGVLTSLYAYYLWTDEVTLDKARRT